MTDGLRAASCFAALPAKLVAATYNEPANCMCALGKPGLASSQHSSCSIVTRTRKLRVRKMAETKPGKASAVRTVVRFHCSPCRQK